MVQEERTRGRPPLTEREKAFRVSARLYARVLTLQEHLQKEPATQATAKPGRPATPVAVLLRETRRKWRESMVTLHALEAAEGLKPSKAAQLIIPGYAEDKRPGRPAYSPVARLTNEIQKEKTIIEGLIAEIASTPVTLTAEDQEVRMGRPPRSPEQSLVLHRGRLIQLQKDLIKARKLEEKEQAAKERAQRQKDEAEAIIRMELQKTQQQMNELRKKLTSKSTAGKARAKVTI